MAEIRVPTLGESVTEATIGKWFKKPGDAVAVDEPLVELETDKVTIEVPAPAAGVLSDIAVKDGDTVAVGALLGQIKEGAGAAPAKARRRQPGGRQPPRRRSLHRRRRAPQAAPPKPAGRRAAGAVGAQARRETGMDAATFPAPARTAASPRATCSRRSSAPPRSRRRSRSQPPPCRCARRRRPTMPHARSACA